MSVTLGSVSSVIGATAYAAVAPSSAAVSTSAPVATSKVAAPVTSSSRFVVDPLAGPITEFFNVKGDVATQFPSATVVAYLKAGLTSDGRPKSEGVSSTTV